MRGMLVVVLVLAGLVSRPEADTLGPGVVTPFEQGEQGGIILPVRLNNRGPFRFLLDTGSTHSVVSGHTAAAIRAPVVAKAPMGSAAGSRETLVVRIDTLETGPLVVSNLLASLMTLDDIGRTDGVDGIIGQDALEPVRYTIDFRRLEVLWWPQGRSMARGTTLGLQSSQGRFLVALPQGHSVLRLVADTGAGAMLLFEPLPDALAVTHLRDTARLTTMSAETRVRLARVRELRIGAATLRDIPTAVIQRDQSEPAEVDGLLPLRLFDRVTVDGPGRQLILEGSGRDLDMMFF